MSAGRGGPPARLGGITVSDETDRRAHDLSGAYAEERLAHGRTRAERDALLVLEESVRRWANDPEYDSCAFEEDLKPIFAALDAARGNCRKCGTPNVPEAQFVGNQCGQCFTGEWSGDSDWAKPADQPATGPLRRKLAVARAVLMEVLDAQTIVGGPAMPTQVELRKAIRETADP